MDACIYLCIADAEGPTPPGINGLAEWLFQGENEVGGDGKMIGGMGGGKAGTLWPVAYEYPDTIGQGGVVAGPEPHDVLFDEVAADVVGKAYQGNGDEDMDPAGFLKVDQYKEYGDEVQGCPYGRITEPGHQPVEKPVLPAPVDDAEPVAVVLQEGLYQIMMPC